MNLVHKLVLVFIGGGVGSAARYLVSWGVQGWLRDTRFPLGTMVVNLVGCFAIGWLGALADVRGVLSAEERLLLVVGVLGGFTTFSTFGYETFQMLRDGQALAAGANVILQTLVGLLAVWGGMAAARLF